MFRGSRMTDLKVADWVCWNDVSDDCEDHVGGCGGYITEGMRWEDHHLCGQPHAEALRSEIVKHGIRSTGWQHQFDPGGAPRFSDGSYGRFTFRAWGDLMAAIWATEENKDYHYMAFYM